MLFLIEIGFENWLIGLHVIIFILLIVIIRVTLALYLHNGVILDAGRLMLRHCFFGGIFLIVYLL